MSDWKEIFVTSDAIEAEMMRDMLESGGIEVAVRSSKITPYPVSIGRMGEMRLLVREEMYDNARKLIESFKE